MEDTSDGAALDVAMAAMMEKTGPVTAGNRVGVETGVAAPVFDTPSIRAKELRNPPLSGGELDDGLNAAMKNKATVTEVTREARRVLERMLQRGFPPLFDGRLAFSEQEAYEECPYTLLQRHDTTIVSGSGLLDQLILQQRGSAAAAAAAAPATPPEQQQQQQYFDEPDYAEPAEPDEESEEQFEEIYEDEEHEDYAYGGHKPVAKTHSVSSQSSYGLSLRSGAALSRSRSPSDKLLLAVHPPKIKCKAKGKKKGLFDSSSSSTEDYEYCDNELLRRKKKSFFKWASERLRQSFRRSKVVEGVKVGGTLVPPPEEVDPGLLQRTEESAASAAALAAVSTATITATATTAAVASAPEDPSTLRGKKAKKGKLKFSLRRSGSQKSKSNHSSSTPSEVNAGNDRPHFSEGDCGSLLRQAEEGSLPPPQDERTRRKSPLPWKRLEVRSKKKEPLIPEVPREKEKWVFGNFLKPFRKGSGKQKKGSKDENVNRQRSRSADNLIIRPISKEHEKLLQRYVDNCHKVEVEYDFDSHTVRSFHESTTLRVEQTTGGLAPAGKPPVVWYPSSPLPPTPADTAAAAAAANVAASAAKDDILSRSGHHSLRRRMHLDGLTPLVPRTGSQELPPAPPLSRANQPIGSGLCASREAIEVPCAEDPDLLVATFKEHQRILHSQKLKSESEDDIDGATFEGTFKPPAHIVDKAFHERTHAEKEELYERIAEQLAAIADHYNLDSPRSPKSSSSPVSGPSQSETEEGATGGAEGAVEAILEKEIEKKVGSSAKQFIDAAPVVAELVRNASYSKFKQIVNENVGSGMGWEQVAIMFRLTQTSVQLAGMGTAAALQIKEMTLRYFEDKFAGWIAGKGGWESMVDDTNTEFDSELD